MGPGGSICDRRFIHHGWEHPGHYCSGTFPVPSNPYTWWRHQMETFSELLAICAGNSPVPVNSPHKGQWRGALMFSLICARIIGWVNNGEVSDLRRQHAHYDAIVMTLFVAGLASFDFALGFTGWYTIMILIRPSLVRGYVSCFVRTLFGSVIGLSSSMMLAGNYVFEPYQYINVFRLR